MYALTLRYSEVGRRQEGQQLSEKKVRTRKRTLGEKHLDTLAPMHALTNVYSEVARR
jgi:hypothetical protein